MTPPRATRSSRVPRFIAAGVLACAVAGLWWAMRSREDVAHENESGRTAGEGRRQSAREQVRDKGAKGVGVASVAALVAKPTRAEAVATVRALYRKEQLTRELDLEQRRYGTHYWESDGAGPALALVEQARAALVRQLSAEANQVLADLFPGETGESVVLAPLFDADHAGPQVSGISAEGRRRFEARLLAEPAERFPAETATLLELAAEALPEAELTVYRRWNAPAAVALRNQLIGFAATEAEFKAILAETATVSATGETEPTALASRLGPERFAAWQAQVSPDVQTALHDLQRLGLPLTQAGWLVALRAEAAASVQQAWQDGALADWAKPARVAQLQTDYAQAIAARLSLGTAVSLDELSLASPRDTDGNPP
jgi:hypothetical protein